MGMHRWLLLMMAAAAAMLVAGCTAVPQENAVKEIRVCGAGDCDTTDRKYSAGQLLTGLQQLRRGGILAPFAAHFALNIAEFVYVWNAPEWVK